MTNSAQKRRLNEEEQQWFKAITDGDLKTLNVFLNKEQWNVNIKDSDGQPGLMVAMKNNQEEVVDWLIHQAHADVNMDLGAGQSCLTYVCRESKDQWLTWMLDVLKEKKITPRNLHEKGWSLLSVAVFKRHLDIVKILLDSGLVDPDAPSDDGLTPLMIAALSEQNETVHQLIKAGADVNKKDLKSGSCVLMYALSRLKTFIILVEAGADWTAVNNKGESVKELAEKKELQDIVDWITAKESEEVLKTIVSGGEPRTPMGRL